MKPTSATLFMAAARQAAAERRFRKALGLLRAAWIVEGQEDIGPWLDSLEAHVAAQEACLMGLLAERAGQIAAAMALNEQAQALEPIARRRLLRFTRGRGPLERPVGRSRPLGPEERQASAKELMLLEGLARESSVAAAVDLAQDILSRVGPLPGLQANLERHLRPHLVRKRWQTLPPEALATTMRADFLEAPGAKTLRNWAIAALRLASVHPEAAPLAASVGMMAIANLESDASLSKTLDLPDPKLAIASLRTELLAWMEGWARQHPEAHDHFRLDLLALRLRGKRRRGPHLAGLFVTPGVYRDPLVSARCAQHTQLGTSDSLLGALYTRWGPSVAAAEAGNFARAAYLEPPGVSSPAERAGARYFRFMEGLRNLRAGDLDSAWPSLEEMPTNDPELRGELMLRLTESCHEGYARIKRRSLAQRLAFAQFQHERLQSPETGELLAEVRAEAIRRDWTRGLLEDAEALIAAQDLVAETPTSEACHALLAELRLVVFGGDDDPDEDEDEDNEDEEDEEFECEF